MMRKIKERENKRKNRESGSGERCVGYILPIEYIEICYIDLYL
jgi:hypothetical protein